MINSNNIIYNRFFYDIKFIYIFYILFCLIMYLLYAERIPSVTNLTVQTIFSIFLIFIMIKIKNYGIKTIILIYLCYSLLLTAILRLTNIIIYNSPYGSSANDAIVYNEIGLYGATHSFKDFFDGIQSISPAITIGDYGFSVWLKLIYTLGWNEVSSQTILIIVNSILVTIGIYIGYKLALLLFSKNFAKVFVLFLISIQYLIHNSVGGCKESLFLLILVISAYYMQRSIQEKSLKTTILFILSTSFIFFFREIICVMYFFAYGVGYFFSFKNNRPFVKIIVILGGILGSLGIGLFLRATGLSSLDQVSSVSEARMGENGGTIGMVVGVVSSLVGPFPNIIGQDPDRPEYFYNFMYFIKMYFSFYFLIGVYLIIKKRVWQFVPELSVVFMTIIMCVVAAVSLDIRYQFTMLIQYFLIATYGINNQIEIKNLRLYRIPYIVMVIVLIYMYNLR